MTLWTLPEYGSTFRPGEWLPFGLEVIVASLSNVIMFLVSTFLHFFDAFAETVELVDSRLDVPIKPIF